MTEIITIDNFTVPEFYSDNDDNIYNPDFTLQRRPNSHTMRKNARDYSHEYDLKIDRPMCANGSYVTAVDEYLNYYDIRSKYPYRVHFALHKNELYDRFIFEIEEKCAEKTISYDKYINMNKTKYKVPAIGMIVDHDNVQPTITMDEMIYDKMIESANVNREKYSWKVFPGVWSGFPRDSSS
jgi:hypothetical protein